MNKKGMTLVELLVYMAIAVLLLAPIIMLMRNSSVNMARDAIKTDMSMSGSDILNIIHDDLKNTGFKLKDFTGAISVVDTMNTTFFTRNPSPANTIKNHDFSSFRSGDAGTAAATGMFDTLMIRKGRLDNATGAWAGHDTIRYHVDNVVSGVGRLVRAHRTFNSAGTAGTLTTQALARNVEVLQFEYLPDLNASPVNGFSEADATVRKASKEGVKYIRVTIVLKDNKKLSATKSAPATTIGNYPFPATSDQALRERHEIVVPIPNNGLFPPAP